MKIINHLTEDDLKYIHQCLSQTYWAKKRTFTQNQIAFNNSLVFLMLDNQGQRVGFARVFTDYAIIAYLTDVFINEAYRGKGFGKLLINKILEHPKLSNIHKFILKTSDASKLYRKFGFTDLKDPEFFMEKYL